MPGYLSNRLISFNPPQEAAEILEDISDINIRLTEAESNIDDLSLNIGV
jgi:hypothetical protein